MSDAIRRRGYLDWVRGLAVLIMIQAHVLDSWTRLDARGAWRGHIGSALRGIERASHR
jgi:uncharacterized membrane protein